MSNSNLLSEDHPDVVRLQTILVEAILIYRERDVKYKGSWKELGWRDSLYQIRLKARRLLTLFSAQAADTDPEEFIDDALDLIVNCAFFIDNVRQERDGVIDVRDI